MKDSPGEVTEMVRLGDVCTFDPSKAEVRGAFLPETPVAFAPMSALGERDRYFVPREKRPFGDVYGGYTYFADGDVLLAKITPCFENGKLGLALNLLGGTGFGSSEFMVIRPDRRLMPEYLFYFLSHDEFRRTAMGVMTGAVGHKRVPKGWVQAQRIRLAPLAEQKRLVAVLDESFEAINIAVSNTRRVQKQIDEITSDVTGTVGEWTLLRDEVDLLTGFAFKSSEYTEASDGVRLLRGDNVMQGRLRWEEVRRWPKSESKEFARFQLNPDDVVIAMDRPWTNAGLKYARLSNADTPALLLQRVARLRARSLLEPCFLELVIASPAFELHVLKKAGGSGVPHISGSQLTDFRFRRPTIGQQQALIEKTRHLSTELGALRFLASRKLALLAELQAAILTRAFSSTLTARKTAPHLTVPSNDNEFTTPEQVANVIAFAQRRHATHKQQLTFGRVKAQKVLHLVEAVSGIDLARRPYKDAAGPNDSSHMRAAERWAKASEFFEFVREGDRYVFKKLLKYDERMSAAEAGLGPIKNKLERATALIVNLDSRKAEVLATVHAAWNNLILDGHDLNEDAIVRAARDEWHPDKLRIPISEFLQAIREIRRLGIIPDGKAKRVGEPLLL